MTRKLPRFAACDDIRSDILNFPLYRHIRRVYGYARPIDWISGAGITALPISLIYYMEWLQPANVGKAGWAKIMRLNGLIGITAGLALVAQQSSCTCNQIIYEHFDSGC